MDNRNFIAHRAAQYFHSGDVVNLGIGIPSICGNYAEEGVFFQTENGFIGVGATAKGIEVSNSMFNAGGIPYLAALGGCGFDVAKSFGIIRSGRMAATVLGALQVSKDGDLANWATPDRAFGMGGAMDLVNGAKQVIIAMELCTKDGSPKIVNECTFPYTGRRCVDHIVTERCVIDVTPQGLVLSELRRGHTVEEIQSAVEPTLIISPDLKEMEEID